MILGGRRLPAPWSYVTRDIKQNIIFNGCDDAKRPMGSKQAGLEKENEQQDLP